MKQAIVLAVVSVCLSGTALAQVPEGGYVAGTLGASVAKESSVLVGGEVGAHVASNMDAFIELGFVPNLPSASRNESAQIISDLVAAQTGAVATYDASTPTFYGSAGLRYFLSPYAGVVPYAEGAIGFARLDQDVKFFADGVDITSSMPDYGITLGSDVAGASTAATLGFGGGIRIPKGQWHFDVGYRYTRIFTDVKGTNANRIAATVGYRF